MWYGKKETPSNQTLMSSIIDGFTSVYCFGRWNSEPEFTYLGIGKVMSYRDNFREVYNKDGSQTFCLEFELNFKDLIVNPTFINNFDNSFEDEIPDTREGKEKYVRHKTQERNPEIIKKKKSEFKK